MRYTIQFRFLRKSIYLGIVTFFLYSCGNKPSGDISVSEMVPLLEPDYSGITIPSNIAPLNFIIKEKALAYYVKFISGNGTEIDLASGNGKILIPQRKWRKLLENNKVKGIKIDVFSKDEPLASEMAPLSVPLTRTFTPGNGRVFDASIIVPETLICWSAAIVPGVLLPEGFSVASE